MRWNKETQDFVERTVKVFISLGVLLTVRLALLQGSLPKFSQQDNPAAFHSSLYVRILTFCYLAAFNWWLLLCPMTLSHDWQMGSVPLVTSIYDSRNLVTCFFFLLTLLLVVKSVCDFEAQRHVPVVVGLALLVLPFLPATNLFVTVGFVVAERVLYIPSMGCILLVIYALQMLWSSYPKHRQTIICFVILMLTTSCLRTIIRNRDWRSRESLLRAGLMTLPQNAKMHYNYGNFLRDSARPELAKTHYHKALKLWPTYASAHNNLGTLLSNEQEAEQHFLAAIRYSSDHVNAHYNLGQLYRKSNKTVASEKMLKRCISIDPRFTPAYIELARLRGPEDMRVGSLLKQVMILNSDDPYYGTLYGNWLLNKGNHAAALRVYWMVLQKSDTHREAMLKAAKILRKTGQTSRLLQTITRWHAILRQRRGEIPLSPHVYLQGWHLKKELSRKAKVYDNCSSTLYGTEYIPTPSKGNNSDNEDKWSHQEKNSSEKFRFASKAQCKSEKSRIDKQGSITPMMVHHLLDSV
ncbi:protein O-mannosyl-transferase TMTC1-like [Coccinella septempunctata]|uniref:protein O-mannosyl-transferase TMTC1-like n=1 Tax=Coccinella septempunctata TaxID=41139 RepID=UPI001D078099|nr:protein O-mannosyl-transferase TMTC1-like [Coccinella septempunctata]